MSDIDLQFMGQQHAEHQAWLAVVAELRKLGVGEINAGEPQEHLHDLIVYWGEELVQLRLNDPNPDHAQDAYEQRYGKIHGA